MKVSPCSIAVVIRRLRGLQASVRIQQFKSTQSRSHCSWCSRSRFFADPKHVRLLRALHTTSMSADLIESAKRAASQRAVDEHFDVKAHKRVGIGSGSTIKYVVDAIKNVCSKQSSPPQILFVPTGHDSRKLVTAAGLIAIDYDTLQPDHDLDVAFDGADEVDDDFNLVKGGGACLFQEKLVAARAKKFVVVAGRRSNHHYRVLTTIQG